MAMSRSLAAMAAAAALFITASAVAQQADGPPSSVDSDLEVLGKFADEAQGLRERSDWKGLRLHWDQAAQVHARATAALAEQQKKLDQEKRRLDEAMTRVRPAQVKIQAILAEARELDDAAFKAACMSVNAETVNGDPSRNLEPYIYSMSSDQVEKLLATLVKQRRTQVISRPSILAIDGQQAQITMGEPVKTMKAIQNEQGETKFEPGIEHTGLTVSLSPTIQSNEQTQIALTIKKCRLHGGLFVIGVEPNGNDITTPIINSEKMETTVKATNGRTILVAVKPPKVLVNGKKPEPTKTTLVLLTPRVVERTADSGEILHH